MLAACLLLLPLLPPPGWDALLAEAGLSPAAVRIDRAAARLFADPPHQPPLRDYLLADPFRAADWLGRQSLALAAAGEAELLERVSHLGGRPLQRPDAALAERPEPGAKLFRPALARFRAAAGVTPGTVFDEPDPDRVPPRLQAALALLLTTCEQALVWRRQALADAPAGELAAQLADLLEYAGGDGARGEGGSRSLDHQLRVERFLAGFDRAALLAAALDLLYHLPALVDLVGGPPEQVVTSRWPTPLGDIILGGPGDDVHQATEPLLLLDIGGNDTYHGGAAAVRADRPVALIIDCAGDDLYRATAPAFGVGVGGLGLLVDLAGDDRYEAGDLSLGCGVAGVGLLLDRSGRDVYVGGRCAQGAALSGFGLLVDRAGDDQYRVAARGQGFGATLGVGLLLDAAGADDYEAGPVAGQRAANLLVQGCGFGRRAERSDGHSLAGGVGLLLDVAGDDRYTARGALAQGVGYYFGVGLLSDLEGADQYRADGSAQGVAWSQGVGVLRDGAGSDVYEADEGLGAGSDFGQGQLIDSAGDDRYRVTRAGLGVGAHNGLGFFHDAAGNDTYDGPAGAFGQATMTGPEAELVRSIRPLSPTWGLFLDAGGDDRYPRGGGNGRTWSVVDTAQRLFGLAGDR